MKTQIIITLCFVLFCHIFYSQTARKPSANYTKEKSEIRTQIKSLSEIKDSNDFDKLARVFNKGTFNEISHLLFAIDRSRSNKVYYINTPKYEFHLYFINDLPGLNYTQEDIKKNYKDDKRRFIFGTVSWQNHIKVYTYEFWEGDIITPEILTITQKVIWESFNDSILFKTNSTAREAVAQSIEIDYIAQDQLVKEHPYIALNPGTAKGMIRIFDSMDDIEDVDENTILVLKEVPISIPAVAGVITEKASTLLSHVNVLARGLKIPSIYIRDASIEMQQYEGKQVPDGFSIPFA
jgi:phosphohistidine swiveling domain-containing protein